MSSGSNNSKLEWTIERRAEKRIFGLFNARFRQAGGKPLDVFVYDLSAGGFCAEWPHRLKTGDRVWLRLEGLESLAAVVTWTTEFMVGCKFDHPLHHTTLLAIAEGRKPG
ncbi:hypothetical protein BH09PSE3_BH09PSE3_14310 [soil metagenome]